MPTNPVTWANGDLVSATRLNNDLYDLNANLFQPTGVLFHARKPLYKASPKAFVTCAATNWTNVFSGVSPPFNAVVLVDSAADYAAWADPTSWGSFQAAVPYSLGGTNSGAGGWYLGSCFTPLATQGDNTRVQAAITQDAATNTIRGTAQRGNTNRNSAPFCIGMLNVGSSYWSASIFNGKAATVATINVNDGSGKTARLQGHWVSATSGNLPAAGPPAPKQSWTGADTWTAAFANGATGVRDILRFLNRPPCLSAQDTSQQIVLNTTNTSMTLNTIDLDAYSGWNAGTGAWTVPYDGIYLLAAFMPWTNAAAEHRVAVNVNGTNYWGPSYKNPSAGNMCSAKHQVFNLVAGDIVKLVTWQNSGASLTAPADQNPRLMVVWLSGSGTPSPLPVPPDTSYRYAAGTDPDLSPIFNAHLANDLTFLTYRPYLLARQTVAQTGIAMGTNTPVTMDTVTGIVHAVATDNYSGWDSVNKQYTAVRPGWYLVSYEVMMALPSLTVSPTNTALLQVLPASAGNPLSGWDFYQQLTSAVSQGFGGAGALGYYYLRTGDSIRPGVVSDDTSATTIATAVSAPNWESHLEVVWVSE